MIRTRDFLLLLTSGAFLVVAIGTTWVTSERPVAVDVLADWESVAPAAVGEAVIEAPPTLDREERLAHLRAAVADYDLSNLRPSAPEPAVESTTTTSDGTALTEQSDEDDVEAESAKPLRCADYQPDTTSWPTAPVKLSVAEGTRLVTIPDPGAPAAVSASGTPSETILAQLPIRQWPTARPSCLPSDVVGIAQDGSLIRNDELALYQIFGADTVIGYALDGFPIHGASSRPTDRCGGAIVNGQYGYYLSTERPVVLGCFSAPPTSL